MCHTAACRLEPAPGNHTGMYLTVHCLSVCMGNVSWPKARGYEQRTQWNPVYEEGAYCALAEGALAGFHELDEGVPFEERSNTVCDLQDIRACHAAAHVKIVFSGQGGRCAHRFRWMAT